LLKGLRGLLWLALCAACLPPGAAAADEPGAGFVKNVTGQAFIERNQQVLPARVRDVLLEKDVLVTGPDGSLGVILQDNGVLSLGANSRMAISSFLFKPAEEKLSFVARLTQGKILYLTGLIAKLDRNAVRFETPTAVCGIRGTRLAIAVEEREL
jgi:hypothetical protein